MDGGYQVTTAVGTSEQAAALARWAVDQRLAACAQVDGPITSTYRWQGAVHVEQEWRIVFKAPEATRERLVTRLVEEHPYDLPEVVVTPVVGGNPAYLEWVATETR